MEGYKHFEFYAGIGEVSLNKIREEFNRFGQKGELYRTESVPVIAEWSTDSTRETITMLMGGKSLMNKRFTMMERKRNASSLFIIYKENKNECCI